MRKVTSEGQMVKAVMHLMSIQPESGSIFLMFEKAIDTDDFELIAWLVHNSDLYKMSGKLMALYTSDAA